MTRSGTGSIHPGSQPPRRRARGRTLKVAAAMIVAVAGVALSTSSALAASPAGAAHARAIAPRKASPPPRPADRAPDARRGPKARASLCSAPLVGDWRNIDANTRAMTRALVDFTCSDVILCDQNGHCTGGDSYYSVQMFGKCHPTDCDWGRARAYPQSDGWIRATYAFGFKTSYVWLKTYSYYGRTYLRVYVNNDFSPSDGRADYTTDEWFLR
jgi:hypothetical protein